MRTVIRLTAALALAAAAPGLAAAQTKIGYVDVQRAVQEVDEGKAAKAVLKKDFDEKQKLLDVKSEEIKKLDADFAKQAMVMSAEAKAQKGAELDRKRMEAQEFYMKVQQDLSKQENDAMRGIVDKVQILVREIGEADGLAMVVSTQALVWGQPSLDITNELIRKYNARFPVGGAKKADAPAAKK